MALIRAAKEPKVAANIGDPSAHGLPVSGGTMEAEGSASRRRIGDGNGESEEATARGRATSFTPQSSELWSVERHDVGNNSSVSGTWFPYYCCLYWSFGGWTDMIIVDCIDHVIYDVSQKLWNLQQLGQLEARLHLCVVGLMRKYFLYWSACCCTKIILQQTKGYTAAFIV